MRKIDKIEKDRRATLEREADHLAEMVEEARSTGHMTAVASLFGRLQETRRRVERIDAAAVMARVSDEIERIEIMQRSAASDGSWVAAQGLGRQAAELRAQREAEQRARAEAEEAARSAGDALDVLVSLVQQMPPDHLRALRDAIGVKLSEMGTR